MVQNRIRGGNPLEREMTNPGLSDSSVVTKVTPPTHLLQKASVPETGVEPCVGLVGQYIRAR